jgi:hypothetical protein
MGSDNQGNAPDNPLSNPGWALVFLAVAIFGILCIALLCR